jgi:hypothetical protein
LRNNNWIQLLFHKVQNDQIAKWLSTALSHKDRNLELIQRFSSHTQPASLDQAHTQLLWIKHTHSLYRAPFLPSIVSFQITGCSYNLNIFNHRCQTPRSCYPRHAAGWEYVNAYLASLRNEPTRQVESFLPLAILPFLEWLDGGHAAGWEYVKAYLVSLRNLPVAAEGLLVWGPLADLQIYLRPYRRQMNRRLTAKSGTLIDCWRSVRIEFSTVSATVTLSLIPNSSAISSSHQWREWPNPDQIQDHMRGDTRSIPTHIRMFQIKEKT